MPHLCERCLSLSLIEYSFLSMINESSLVETVAALLCLSSLLTASNYCLPLSLEVSNILLREALQAASSQPSFDSRIRA